MSGECKIIKKQNLFHFRELATLPQGGYFGEDSVLFNTESEVTVLAATESVQLI